MTAPVARELFGRTGEVFDGLLRTMTAELPGRSYRLMEPAEYEALLRRSLADGMRVYWVEMLQRAHWAAASSILRHKGWHDACVALYHPRANYLGFAASLRGLLEAAADAYYSLSSVPATLAEHHSLIEAAVSGRTTTMVLSEQLEDALIHFQFARRLEKTEAAPDSHKAAKAETYLRTGDGPNRTGMKDLYAEVCQIVHPAAQSVLWFAKASPEVVQLTKGDDRTLIHDLCRRHAGAIDALYMQSVNASILIFKVLNRFSISELHMKSVESISMREIPLWKKIERGFASKGEGDEA